jgi:hypothetical protein
MPARPAASGQGRSPTEGTSCAAVFSIACGYANANDSAHLGLIRFTRRYWTAIRLRDSIDIATDAVVLCEFRGSQAILPWARRRRSGSGISLPRRNGKSRRSTALLARSPSTCAAMKQPFEQLYSMVGAMARRRKCPPAQANQTIHVRPRQLRSPMSSCG